MRCQQTIRDVRRSIETLRRSVRRSIRPGHDVIAETILEAYEDGSSNLSGVGLAWAAGLIPVEDQRRCRTYFVFAVVDGEQITIGVVPFVGGAADSPLVAWPEFEDLRTFHRPSIPDLVGWAHAEEVLDLENVDDEDYDFGDRIRFPLEAAVEWANGVLESAHAA